jgi:hypothetical protein
MAFGYYTPVTIDHTKCGASDSSNFPVLFNTVNARFKTVANGGHVQNSSGFDIRPYSDSGLTTALSFELERYNASTGEVVMWIKESTVSHTSDTVYYLGYGDSGISTDGSSGATWSNSFLVVYHLKDGTTLNTNDSVAGSINLINNNSVTAAAGQIDGGAGFLSASSQYLENGSLTGATGAVTVSGWVNATSFPNAYNAVTGYNRNTPTVQAMIWVKSTGKLTMFVQATGSVGFDGTGTTTLSTSTWYYLVLTYNVTSGMVGYINAAVEKTVSPNGNLITSAVPAISVGRDSVTAGRFWNGSLDEARVATVARSADWVTTEYNNQNSPSTFYTLGTEVPLATVNAAAFFRIF